MKLSGVLCLYLAVQQAGTSTLNDDVSEIPKIIRGNIVGIRGSNREERVLNDATMTKELVGDINKVSNREELAPKDAVPATPKSKKEDKDGEKSTNGEKLALKDAVPNTYKSKKVDTDGEKPIKDEELALKDAVPKTFKSKRVDKNVSKATNGEELVLASPAEFIGLKDALAMSEGETDRLSKELEKEDVESAGLTEKEQETLGRLLKTVTSLSALEVLDKPRQDLSSLLKLITKSIVQLQSRFLNHTKQTTSVKKEVQLLKTKFANAAKDLKETRLILEKIQNSHVGQSPDSGLMKMIEANSKGLRVMKKEFGDLEDIRTQLAEMRPGIDKRLNVERAGVEQCRLLDQQMAMMFELWHLTHKEPEPGSVKVTSASQSSTGWTGVASRAIDGNKNPRYWELSCSHTQGESHPWLLLKLGGPSRVTGVELTNRGDCCHKRLSNFSIQVFKNEPTSSNLKGELCNNFTGTVGKAATQLIKCNAPVIGRYVKIMLEQNSSDAKLTVCEAVVKGESLNELQGKPTLLSSVASGSSLSDRANDGDITTCSETLARSDGSASWWQVDMGRTILVKKVFLWNREDVKYAPLQNLTITLHETLPSVCSEVTSHICMTYPVTIGQGRTFTLACKRPIRGRYLKIQTTRKDGDATLTLCEVSVNEPITQK